MPKVDTSPEEKEHTKRVFEVLEEILVVAKEKNEKSVIQDIQRIKDDWFSARAFYLLGWVVGVSHHLKLFPMEKVKEFHLKCRYPPR